MRFDATQAWISFSYQPIARKPIRTFLGKVGSCRADVGLANDRTVERESPMMSRQVRSRMMRLWGASGVFIDAPTGHYRNLY